MRHQAKVWRGRETVSGATLETVTIILGTRGCAWHELGGCLMCGYHYDSDPGIDPDVVDSQLDGVNLSGAAMAKVYTSGSFLDEREVSSEARGRIYARLANAGITRIVVESRPEFVDEHHLGQLRDSGLAHEIAFGLESADDRVRALCVRKGFSFADYAEAAGLVRASGGSVRTYLLLKPPLMTERAAMGDLVASIRKAAPLSDTISINPVNVQGDTYLEGLFKAGRYRPPWFWSLFSAIMEAGPGTRIVSDPSGAGKRRGIHNCGRCDDAAIGALRRFNDSGDPSVLDIGCGCRGEWQALLEIEGVNSTVAYEERKSDW